MDVLLIDDVGTPVVIECKQDAPTLGHLRQLRNYRNYMAQVRKDTGKLPRGILVHGGARTLRADVRIAAQRKRSNIWCPVRVLLDECVPRKLRRDLLGHEVRTVTEMGWAGTRNGRLLRQAAAQFDIFLTVDQGIEFQQSLTGLDLAVIVMATSTNDINDLRPLIPRVLAALVSATSLDFHGRGIG